MNYRHDGDRHSAEASLAVVAVGWQANTAELNLAVTGAKIDARGFVLVDPYLQTTTSRTFMPREMLPGDCCSFHRRSRTALWPRPTRSVARR